jgi:prepilin-type N-terminal cleavage/methylation domain-containing protein
MPKQNRGLTLIELLVSMVLMSLVILGLSSVNSFSRHHVISSDKRAKVQNEISYALEHMSKYVQQSNGSLNQNAIVPSATGFRVYIDLGNPQTPSDLTDDGWIDYTLSLNTLTATCSANGGNCPFTTPENLSDRIIAGVASNTVMPEFPAQGFYVNITDQGTAVDIGLTGRYDPAVAASPENPQISMKTRLVSSSASASLP